MAFFKDNQGEAAKLTFNNSVVNQITTYRVLSDYKVHNAKKQAYTKTRKITLLHHLQICTEYQRRHNQKTDSKTPPILGHVC